MIWIYAAIYLMMGVIFLILKKNVFYPAASVNIIFSIVMIGYALSKDIYVYKLSEYTLSFILLNVFLFSLSGYVVESLVSLTTTNSRGKAINYLSNGCNIKLGVLVCMLCVTYMCLRLQGYVIGDNFFKYLNEIRQQDVEDSGRSFISYLQPFILVSFSFYVYSNIIAEKKISGLINVCIFAVFFSAILMNTGKQIVFMAMISFFYINGVKKIKHYIYLTLSVAVLFILYMLLLRGLNGSIVYYLSMYLVSPVVAFQQFYLENNSYYGVSHAFWFFERLWGIFSGGTPLSLHKEFVWIGLPTNVYTAFSDYVSISPWLSYVIMVIHGGLASILWKYSGQNVLVKIFYSYFIYTFAFMFYHESFLVNISSWIQMIIAIFITYYFARVRKAK